MCLLDTVVSGDTMRFTSAVPMSMGLQRRLKHWRRIVLPKRFVTSIHSFILSIKLFFDFNSIQFYHVFAVYFVMFIASKHWQCNNIVSLDPNFNQSKGSNCCKPIFHGVYVVMLA